MSVVGSSNGSVKIAGRDVASFFYNTEKGVGRLKGVFCWLFRKSVWIDKAEINKLVWPNRNTVFIRNFLRCRTITSLPAERNLPRMRHNTGCGAQSLRRAAEELGIRHLPENSFFRGELIKDVRAEDAIFKVTKQPLYGMSVESTRLIGGDSRVDQILATARKMGLKGQIYSSWRNYFDLRFLRSEVAEKKPDEWREINAYSSIKLGSVKTLSDSERLIVHCQGANVKLGHIVMQRPDGSCYDPYDGSYYQNIAQFTKKKGWKPSGLSILIHRD